MMRLYRFEDSHPDSLSSRKAFHEALAIEPRRLDCLAGEAFLYQALGMHSDAAGRAQDVLAESGNDYEFEHDPDITTSDIRYCYAVSEVALGNFDEALAMAKVLDPSIDLDPDDASTWDGHLSFEEALVVVIEGLRDRV